MNYSIEDHKHRFAAWAAARAAAVKGYRFSVLRGNKVIEAVGLPDLLSAPARLPRPSEMSEAHREWRARAIASARSLNLDFSHGVAAKLINVYLKSGFTCAGLHQDERVRSLHPPIDRLLLAELKKANVGGFRAEWGSALAVGWSNFDSIQYEKVIDCVKKSTFPDGMWTVEAYWRGYQ
jgi:hypothetical protein